MRHAKLFDLLSPGFHQIEAAQNGDESISYLFYIYQMEDELTNYKPGLTLEKS